jgi:hypothetical protein
MNAWYINGGQVGATGMIGDELVVDLLMDDKGG